MAKQKTADHTTETREAHQEAPCDDCDGEWFWTINRDGRYGPLFPAILPCPGCVTGKTRAA